jgi:Tfp pilus assembly protein PilF
MPSANLNARMSYDQGRDYFSRQEFDRAADHFKMAVEKDPHFEEAHQFLAQSYERLGYAHRAKKAWEALLRVARDPALQADAKAHLGQS